MGIFFIFLVLSLLNIYSSIIKYLTILVPLHVIKNKILSCKFEDLICFIERLMNQMELYKKGQSVQAEEEWGKKAE